MNTDEHRYMERADCHECRREWANHRDTEPDRVRARTRGQTAKDAKSAKREINHRDTEIGKSEGKGQGTDRRSRIGNRRFL